MVAGPRRLLTRLREMMATGAAPLPDVVRLAAGELEAEVCSIYVLRHGDMLELIATHGLRPDAVGLTRLRVGEGIVGICAATNHVMNLPGASMTASNWRGRVAPSPSSLTSVMPAAAKASASSMATVSTTSTSSVE